MNRLPIEIATRIGIGVYDPQWWEARLSLFESITLPSISRLENFDIRWTLILDEDIPTDILNKLWKAIRSVKLSFANILFVPDSALINNAIVSSMRSRVAPNERLVFQMIDDDDAVSADFYPNALDIMRLIQK